MHVRICHTTEFYQLITMNNMPLCNRKHARTHPIIKRKTMHVCMLITRNYDR